MPVEILWEPGGVCRRYVGVVTIAERREAFAQVCSDGRFDNLRFSISDYRDAQRYETTPEAIEESAALHVGPLLTNRNILLASVVTDERIVAAIQQFNTLGLIGRPYRIFATMAEARRWIESARPATLKERQAP